MRLVNSINRNLLMITVIAVAILIVTAPMGAATTTLNLPSTLVNVTVFDSTESHFNTTLSNVPQGYDVTNNTYLGWCIDASTVMTRNETFEAMLYSSLSPPSGNWSTARWDMANYILNHKQGNANDTQAAIWYFINNTTNFNQTLTLAANATIEDALTNGNGFIPSPGQTAAAIVLPQIILPGSGPFQDSIIEVSTPLPLIENVTVSGEITQVGTNSYHMDSGASATFTANVQGGTQPYSYTWYVNGTANSSNQSMNFTAQQTGTYSINVTVTDSENPIQQTTPRTITVTVPEYSALVIVLLWAAIPFVVLVRKKKVHV
jgi:hypothetical protein